MQSSGLEDDYGGSLDFAPDIQSTPQALSYRENIRQRNQEEIQETLGSTLKYHVLGVSQLMLRLYTLFIVLLIVTVFELKRTLVSVMNHLALFSTSLLSTFLFTFVLLHELVLSLRRNLYYLLHFDEDLVDLKLPSSAKYSQLHALFWSTNTSQKIRVSDDFQSFEILPDSQLTLMDQKMRSRSDFAADDKEHGINLSFVSSPGISRVQQFNNKYKEKLKKRPHWWKVGGYPETVQESFEGESFMEGNLNAEGQESYSPKDLKASDFEGSKFILASSPQADIGENEDTNKEKRDHNPIKHLHSPSVSSSKLSSKIKVAMDSTNRHSAINQYVKNLKTFKTQHHDHQNLLESSKPTHHLKDDQSMESSENIGLLNPVDLKSHSTT